jgi:23S rRNA pseudouridine2605 synthase
VAEVRLQRFLSQAGVAARRKAEVLITEGRVEVNGKIVTKLGTKVDPSSDRVRVDGDAVAVQDLFYVVLNKPKGCITAVSDDRGRQTVMEYVPGVPVNVAPVGRLDFYTEGVLLLTNDGELSSRLQSPKSKTEKTYHVKVKGKVTPHHLGVMRRGVRLDDGVLTRPAQVDRLKAKTRHEWLIITLTEGKSRQIRRMAEALGYQVQKLQRVAFAGIGYHGLRVGDARELSQIEVNSLRDMVRLPKNTVSRGKWRSKREDTDLGRRAKARDRGDDQADAERRRQGKKIKYRKGSPAAGGPASSGPASSGPSTRGPAKSGPSTRGPAKRGPSKPTRGASKPTRGPAKRGSAKRGPAKRGPSKRGPSKRR